MNAVHIGKTVYSDKRIPHYVDDPAKATHRYLDGRKWKYMEARSHEDFVKWSAGWMVERHSPQRKTAGIWRDVI